MYLPQDCGGLSTAGSRVAKIRDVPTTLNGNFTEIGTRNRYAGAMWFVGWTISINLLSAGAIKLAFNHQNGLLKFTNYFIKLGILLCFRVVNQYVVLTVHTN